MLMQCRIEAALVSKTEFSWPQLTEFSRQMAADETSRVTRILNINTNKLFIVIRLSIDWIKKRSD